MSNEQKPFEIMEVRELQVAVDTINGVCLTFEKSVTENYFKAANDEIRRLQKQLADAPAWGDWVDADSSLHFINAGFYDVEFADGSTKMVTSVNLRDMLRRAPTKMQDGEVVKNKVIQYKYFNYTPQPAQPARAVEKTYDDVTAKGIAESKWAIEWIKELAADLLAAEAELRELKGAPNAE